jgi:hypothetical protein
LSLAFGAALSSYLHRNSSCCWSYQMSPKLEIIIRGSFGSGKSTLALEIEKLLVGHGFEAEVLDFDRPAPTSPWYTDQNRSERVKLISDHFQREHKSIKITTQQILRLSKVENTEPLPTLSCVYCDHANECPVQFTCSCPMNCYCKREGNCRA